MQVRLILIIRELFFQNFQSLEIVGDMYQERRRSVTIRASFQKQKKNRFVEFTCWKKNPGKPGRLKKLLEKYMEITGKKLSDKNDPCTTPTRHHEL